MEIHDKFPNGFNNDIYNKILQRNMEHAKQQITNRFLLQTEIRAERFLLKNGFLWYNGYVKREKT